MALVPSRKLMAGAVGLLLFVVGVAAAPARRSVGTATTASTSAPATTTGATSTAPTTTVSGHRHLDDDAGSAHDRAGDDHCACDYCARDHSACDDHRSHPAACAPRRGEADAKPKPVAKPKQQKVAPAVKHASAVYQRTLATGCPVASVVLLIPRRDPLLLGPFAASPSTARSLPGWSTGQVAGSSPARP